MAYGYSKEVARSHHGIRHLAFVLVAFLVVPVGFTSLSVGIDGRMDEPVSVPARVAFAAAGAACILMSVVAVKLVLAAAILFGMVHVSPGLNDAVGRMSWR